MSYLKIGDQVTHTEERPNQIATVLRSAGDRVIIQWADGHTYGALPKYLRTVTINPKPATYDLDDVMEAFGITREELETDDVNNPTHYTNHPSGIETIELTQHETFLRGNILKYILRAPYKGNELQDLEKAAWYINREIQRLKDQP